MGKLGRWVIAAVVVLVVVVLGVLVGVPAFLNTASFRSKIEATLTQSLGRKVTIADMDVSLFSGGLVAKNVTIADDPQFSSQPFVQAEKVTIGVEIVPLILHKELHVTSFTLDAPRVVLLSGPNNTWNYSSLGGAKTRSAQANSDDSLANLNVGAIDINNGRVSVGEIAAPGQPAMNARVYDKVDVDAKQFGFSKSFPFSASAHLAGDGTISAKGQAGPVNETNAAATPFAATVSANNINLATSGLLAPDAGIAGVAKLEAKLVSNGSVLSAEGTTHVDRLQVARNGAPSPVPVDLQFAVNNNLSAMTGEVRSATLNIGQAKVLLAGTYQSSPGKTGAQTTALRMDANGQGMPINQLTEFLPAVGVRLPSGTKLQGGTLSAKLAVTGSTAAPVINGPISIRGTELAGFDLGQRLGPLAGIAGVRAGTPTRINLLDANLSAEGGAVRATGINLQVASLGTAAGALDVGASGAMNGRLLVKLTNVNAAALKNVGALAGGGNAATGQLIGLATGALGGLGGGAAGGATDGAVNAVVASISKNGVPVVIGGTTSTPSFSPDLSGIKRGAAEGATKGLVNSLLGGRTGNTKQGQDPLGQALGGLFGRH